MAKTATGQDPAATSPRASGIVALVLLLSSLLFGGGGSPAPMPEMILEIVAVLLFALWLLLPQTHGAVRSVPPSARVITVLALAVPLVQLIPLPPLLWHHLPGREIELEALSLIGRENSWRPWSLVPDRTLASALALLPPLAMLIVASTLSLRQHRHLMAALVIVGVATLGIGTLQLTAPAESPVHFYGVTTPTLRGFQANHNAAADLLIAAMIAGAVLLCAAVRRSRIPGRRGPVLAVAAVLAALFAFGVLFTRSRMGILLLPLAFAAKLWLLRLWLPSLNRRTLLGGAAVVAAIAIGGGLLISHSPALKAVAQRFEPKDDLRLELWRDGLVAARRYYPLGVGMGGFVPALVLDERLEVVRPAMPNRAHNEYVELAVEAGFFGLMAWGAIAFLVARAALVARRAPGPGAQELALGAAAVLVVLVLHSAVDYPFRSMSLAVLGAACAGLLLRLAHPAAEGSFGKDPM